MTVLGAVNWDTTLFEDSFASPGEEVPVTRVEEGPGGKGGNVAVAAARLQGRGRVSFVGALGSDPRSKALRRSLDSQGVDTRGVVFLRGRRSGEAFIVVDRSGAKSIHTHFGANEGLSSAHVRAPGPARAISSASTVVVMDVPVPAAGAAAKMAKDSGARLVYSAGVRAGAGVERLAGVLRLADDLVVDRSELASLLGTDSPGAGVEALCAEFPGLAVAATLGPRGCIIGSAGSLTEVPPVRLEDLGLSAVNATGSGDAFLAAYVCYSGSGRSRPEAAMWGNLAGALKATSAATRGSPTRSALERKMAALEPLRRLRPG